MNSFLIFCIQCTCQSVTVVLKLPSCLCSCKSRWSLMPSASLHLWGTKVKNVKRWSWQLGQFAKSEGCDLCILEQTDADLSWNHFKFYLFCPTTAAKDLYKSMAGRFCPFQSISHSFGSIDASLWQDADAGHVVKICEIHFNPWKVLPERPSWTPQWHLSRCWRPYHTLPHWPHWTKIALNKFEQTVYQWSYNCKTSTVQFLKVKMFAEISSNVNKTNTTNPSV